MAKSRTSVGDLRERVTIRQPAETQDGAGQVAQGWADVATVFAGVEYDSAREVTQGAKVIQLRVYRVTIRRRDDLLAAGGKWQLVWLGRTLKIEAAGEADGKREFAELLCVESV